MIQFARHTRTDLKPDDGKVGFLFSTLKEAKACKARVLAAQKRLGGEHVSDVAMNIGDQNTMVTCQLSAPLSMDLFMGRQGKQAKKAAHRLFSVHKGRKHIPSMVDYKASATFKRLPKLAKRLELYKP